MNSSVILSVTTFVYGISSICHISSLIFKRKNIGTIGRYFAYLAFLLITIGFLFRWIESYDMGIGHVPLSNLYESLIFFSWGISFIYLIFEKKFNNQYFGCFIIPIAFLSIAYASLSTSVSSEIKPLIPALQSNWLLTHVVTCFLGYSAFAISFGISILYIIIIMQEKFFKTSILLNLFIEVKSIELMNYQLVVFGFVFLSIGIITGSVWANSAWGSYWSWDPKETWSLITWFIYAVFIHVSFIKKWSGKKMAYISIIGFFSVLFTYFGVNYLHGLHSYSSM